MGGNQLIGHVARVRGGVADALKTVDPGQTPHQTRQRHVLTIAVHAVVGVDVLAEQADLHNAAFHQRAHFVLDGRHRAGGLRAAGVGHHAEGAELVASFLRRHACRRAVGAALLRQLVELGFRREIGVEHAGRLAAFLRLAGAGQHLGQTMVGLRAEHHVHGGRAAHDLGAFGLRNAAGHGNQRLGPLLLAGAGSLAQAAHFRIDLLCGLLADMAGVKNDEIGLVRIVRRAIALGAEQLAHTLGVIHVHLAAEGLDQNLLAAGGGGIRHRNNARSCLVRRTPAEVCSFPWPSCLFAQ